MGNGGREKKDNMLMITQLNGGKAGLENWSPYFLSIIL